MNINGYLRKFGNWSLLEVPFNHVDALILSELAYVNVDLLIPHNKNSVVLRTVKDELLDKNEVYVGSVDAKFNKVMLKLMKESIRFRDIVIGGVVKKYSHTNVNQFYCFNIFLPNKTMFITYRGTDTTLIGWKEDFLLTYQDVTLAQTQALEYTNQVLEKNKYNYYLGGHSKGGNLAFYAVLNMNPKYNTRLIKAFSFDGPGFKNGINKFPNIQALPKMIKFRTRRDMIGNFFNNFKKTEVVHSNGLLLGGHDPFYWQIDQYSGEFKTAKDVSKHSFKNFLKFEQWLDTLSDSDRALTVDAVFKVFSGNETIYDILRNFGNVTKTFKSKMLEYSKEDRYRLKIILGRLFGYVLNINRWKKFTYKKSIKKDDKIKDKNA